jgi:hypothetical protein
MVLLLVLSSNCFDIIIYAKWENKMLKRMTAMPLNSDRSLIMLLFEIKDYFGSSFRFSLLTNLVTS